MEEKRQSLKSPQPKKELFDSYQDCFRILKDNIKSLINLEVKASLFRFGALESVTQPDHADSDEDDIDEHEADSMGSQQSLSQKGKVNEVIGPNVLNVDDISSQIIKQVVLKLRGDGPSSVSQEVNELIRKATDKQRLAQMYEGWMAWI